MKTKTEQIFDQTCPWDHPYQGVAARHLYVCSAGLLRSATSAKVAMSLGYNARACGSASYALIPISANLIMWANKIIFVHEDNYYEVLETFENHAKLLEEIERKKVIWDIEDIYNYNDSVLVDKIEQKLLS